MKKAILAVLAVVFVFGLMGCASTPKYQEVTLLELKQQIENVKSAGQDFVTFVTEAYIFTTETGSDSIIISNTQNQNDGIRVYLHGDRICSFRNCKSKIDNKHYKHIILYQNNDLVRRIDTSKKYTVYIGVYYDNSSQSWEAFADRIDGQFRTPEESVVFEAQKKAEQESAAEARRLAQEEANRYDPSKFAIVPSDFRPANYISIDLFTAVANVEKMPRGDSTLSTAVIAMLEGTPNERVELAMAVVNIYLYVSDVVFVNQNGTDIQFRTADNAISQIMKTDERAGLTSGQRVRLYYVVSKNIVSRNLLTEWRVRAIERL